jgi:hypothetical protein
MWKDVVMAQYKVDLGIMVPSGATLFNIDVPLLEGTLYSFSLYVSA